MRFARAVRILDHRSAADHDRAFLPGMGRTWLLPLYDVFSRVSGVRGLHRRTVELARVAPGQAVLDVGCGTGNLSLAVLAAEPGARVTALDPDRAALRRAGRKARRRRVSLILVQGYADRLPAEDASLDHVVSSLALHHLDEDGRLGFAREALRTLRQSGTVTILDFAGPAQATDHGHHADHAARRQGHHHGPAHAWRRLPRLLPRGSRPPSSPAADGDVGPALIQLLSHAGFADAQEVEHMDHRFGRMSIVRATRP